MSFVLNMGNDRMNRIKILQQEKQRNLNLRKTGGDRIMHGQQKTTTSNIDRFNQPKQTIAYTQCPYCKQQVLTTSLQHHISYCKAAYKPRTKGNCSACQQFRSK